MRSGAVLDIEYNYDLLRADVSRRDIDHGKRLGMWRYLPMMPLPGDVEVPEIVVGDTPLSSSSSIAGLTNVRSVLIKDESRQPSGSLKDRASAIAVVHARHLGYKTIATASTGNAAAALSCLAANIGLDAIVYVPHTTPAEKMLAIRAYGAKVAVVQGTYDEAFDACVADANRNGWYIRNTALNPLMTEGKKTVAFEICAQMGWVAPDSIFVSVGDGSIIGAIGKGFEELRRLGWIEKSPRIFGVQAEGSNFLYRAWQRNADLDSEETRSASSIADSLQAELPKDRYKALAAVVKTAGAYIEVSDLEILRAMQIFASCGYLSEPAAAAALAGLIKAREQALVSASEQVILVNTGGGLKDTRSIEMMLREYASSV